MGYSEGTSPKGLDIFNSTPQTVADLNRLRELIELVGNFRQGTSTQMNALTAPKKYPGLMFYATDLDTLYACDSHGAWQVLSGAPEDGTVTSFGANYSFGSGTPPLLRRRGQKVTLTLQVTRSVDMQIGNVAFTIPLRHRPAADRVVVGAITTGSNDGFMQWLIAAATGFVTVKFFTSTNGSPRTAWLTDEYWGTP